MSLTTRFILILQGVLCLAGLLGSLGFYGTVRHNLEAANQNLLDFRLVWLKTGTHFDAEDLELELEPGMEPEECAEYWKIATTSGRTLWESTAKPPKKFVSTRQEIVTLGMYSGTLSPDDAIFATKGPDEMLGLSAGAPKVDSAPDAPETKESAASLHPTKFTKYGVRDGSYRIELVFTVQASGKAMKAELSLLAGALGTAVPVGLVLTGILLTFLIRWQLKPLAQIASEAEKIGSQNLKARIVSSGTAKECVMLQNSINAMLARLEEGIQRERRFSAVAAHELRTPVAQLRTSFEVILRRERSLEEYKQALSEGLTDVERLQNLFAALLQLTRAENSDLKEKVCTPMGPVMKRLRERYPDIRMAAQTGVENTTVAGNEELLLAAVGNVVENARRYAPGEPPLVRIQDSGKDLEILVEDRGPGIPEGDRERIFEPLMRLDQARTIQNPAEGFGLGLTVARSMARAVRGELTVGSRADGLQGSVFTFKFPKGSPSEALKAGGTAYDFSNLDVLPAPRPQAF